MNYTYHSHRLDVKLFSTFSLIKIKKERKPLLSPAIGPTIEFHRVHLTYFIDFGTGLMLDWRDLKTLTFRLYRKHKFS